MDLTTLITLLMPAADAQGGWSGFFSLPFAPAAAGLLFTAQVGLTGTAGPFGVDLSNAVELTLGY